VTVSLILNLVADGRYEGAEEESGCATPRSSSCERTLYDPVMTAKAIQISMDTDLLGRIDADPEARRRGRSAFVRTAVQLYLKAKARKEVEERLAHAYEGNADALLEEVEALMGSQAWPSD